MGGKGRKKRRFIADNVERIFRRGGGRSDRDNFSETIFSAGTRGKKGWGLRTTNVLGMGGRKTRNHRRGAARDLTKVAVYAGTKGMEDYSAAW